MVFWTPLAKTAGLAVSQFNADDVETNMTATIMEHADRTVKRRVERDGEIFIAVSVAIHCINED